MCRPSLQTGVCLHNAPFCARIRRTSSIFQSICHWREREDSMGIDAGGAGLHRAAMDATPNTQNGEATQGKSLKNALSALRFEAGSMQPKVEAACQFSRDPRRRAVN